MPKKKTEETTPQTLEELIKEINKKHGDNTIGFINQMPTLDIDRLSSGSLWLDYSLGGGWPLTRIVELFGAFSSGKTLISLKTIVEAQKKGYQCCFVDCENTFDPRFAEKIGVDTDKLLITQSSLGEPTIDMICSLLQAGVKVIVVDSVAALVPSSEVTNPMEQQTIGLHARLMSKALRKMTALNQGSLVIFINQQRENVGGFSPYGPSLTTTGGRALGFYASVRVEVKRGEDIEEQKQKIGQVIKFKVQKNKTSTPFKSGYIKYMYGRYDFDGTDEAISLGLILKIIQQRGAYYDFEGQNFKGRADLDASLRTDKALYNSLKEQILTYENLKDESAEEKPADAELREVEKKDAVAKKGKK